MLIEAFPSPAKIVKSAWNSMCTYGKQARESALQHKRAILVAGAIIAGGVIVYKSETVQKFIKEFLGFELKKPVHYVVPTRQDKESSSEKIVYKFGDPLSGLVKETNEECSSENEEASVACNQEPEDLVAEKEIE